MKKAVGVGIIIPLKGLALGRHTFGYSLGQDFFDYFENQDIRDARIEIAITLEKEAGWIRVNMALDGTLLRSCDRCLGDITTPVTYSVPIMVKFAKMQGEEERDELIVLEPTDAELDLTQYVYDTVCVNLPLQSLHPPGLCDPLMEQKIAELSITNR